MLFSLLNTPPASASTAAGSGGAGAPGAGAGIAAAGAPAAARAPKRGPHALREGAARALFAAAAALSIAAVALICLFLLANGVPAMAEIGLPEFLFGTTWRPANDLYGIFPMIVGSLYVTAGAMIVGVPGGLLTALYLSRFARGRTGSFLRCGVGLLLLYAVAALTRQALEPRLLGGSLGLPPVVTLAALYVGYRVMGVAGMIVFPLLAVFCCQLYRSIIARTPDEAPASCEKKPERAG